MSVAFAPTVGETGKIAGNHLAVPSGSQRFGYSFANRLLAGKLTGYLLIVIDQGQITQKVTRPVQTLDKLITSLV